MIPILASHDPVDHVLPHRFFELLPFNFNFGVRQIPLLGIDFGPPKLYFTNHLLMTLVAAVLCFWLMRRVARQYATLGPEPRAPRGLANLVESLLLFVRDQVARPVLAHRTESYLPLLWTLFFFILFCNLLGMIPLDSFIYLVSGRRLQHIGGTATGNLAITGGLAIIAFLAIHVSGVHAVYVGLRDGTFGTHHDESHATGHGDPGAPHYPSHPYPHDHGKSAGVAATLALPLYLWNFAPHVFKPDAHAGALTKLLMWPPDVVMWVFLLALELLGALIKPFALMIRLFANMIAGHIVLASILALTFILGSYLSGVASALGCVALSFLELFVAFLQAYIFVFLTTLFLGAAVAPEH